MSESVAAIDLGATSGRVMLGHVGHNELSVRPVARFPNTPVRVRDGLHWNILELYRNVIGGLNSAVREEPAIASVGVDSWAVDYALMREGRMLATPYHYRDDRTAAGVAKVHHTVSAEQLFRANGLQHLPFNTLFQLAVDADSGLLDAADTMLLIPDLITYWFTGHQLAEATNASTTGLTRVGRPEWNAELAERLGIAPSILPPIVQPGTDLGSFGKSVRAEIGAADSTRVVTVGSHDTASAVVAIPATTAGTAFISCGTWGLVGIELEHPVITDAARLANFTNEAGVDGRVRFLHNVMGLWLLTESVTLWNKADRSVELPGLLAQAAALDRPPALFDVNDPVFLAPGDMPGRIRDWFTARSLPAPTGHPEFVRTILESLASAFAGAIRKASELSGTTVTAIHLVGGGSQNQLLCQLTADYADLPVIAGPVEATAIGNILIQARTQGFAKGSLESLRALVVAAFPARHYLPTRA